MLISPIPKIEIRYSGFFTPSIFFLAGVVCIYFNVILLIKALGLPFSYFLVRYSSTALCSRPCLPPNHARWLHLSLVTLRLCLLSSIVIASFLFLQERHPGLSHSLTVSASASVSPRGSLHLHLCSSSRGRSSTEYSDRGRVEKLIDGS